MTYSICSGCSDKIPYSAAFYLLSAEVGSYRDKELQFCTWGCLKKYGQ